MTTNYLLADAIARIKNALLVFKSHVVLRHSGMVTNCLNVLKENGYISSYVVMDHSTIKGAKVIVLELAYHDKKPVISCIDVVSKPSRRVYKKASEVSRFYNGLGIHIISTSEGVKSDYEVRQRNIGGELLISVY